MSNITPMGKGWKRKQELAAELEVSTRWISKLVNRGEIEKTMCEGTPWFRIPPTEHRELEEGTPLKEEPNQGDKGENPEEGTGKLFEENSGSSEQFAPLREVVLDFESLYLEEKQKALEQRDEMRIMRSELTDLRVSLTEAQTALVHVERERDRLQVQNEALQRALEQRTIFQSLVLWLKSFWSK